MNIYLIRHSDSEGLSKGMKDFERGLTPEGEIKIRNACLFWQNIITEFDFIISSPYLRALQTAKIIASVYNYKKEIVIDRRIGCGSETDDLIEILNNHQSGEIAIVGHQPDLSIHVSRLISGTGASIEFKKAAIAKISFSGKVREGKGVLEFLVPPGLFIPK
ncbi:MAG: histidine phosphatase family protein [Ignavibacteriaceae bacterium]|nr:histidine phosphatase family protein [Ignavibacteriaceae bacterium]